MYPADDALEFMEYRPGCCHDFSVKMAIFGFIDSNLYCFMVFACSKCGEVDDG